MDNSRRGPLEGTAVELFGLSTSDLNGRSGRADTFDIVTRRYLVSMRDGKTYSVRPENVRHAPHPATAHHQRAMLCSVCGAAPSMLCANCLAAAYCGVGHQHAAWTSGHELDCVRVPAVTIRDDDLTWEPSMRRWRALRGLMSDDSLPAAVIVKLQSSGANAPIVLSDRAQQLVINIPRADPAYASLTTALAAHARLREREEDPMDLHLNTAYYVALPRGEGYWNELRVSLEPIVMPSEWEW